MMHVSIAALSSSPQSGAKAELPPCGLAVEVASGRLRAIDLTEAALARLSEAGPRLAALAWLNDRQARHDARAADALATARGQGALASHPLLGLPISIKEGLRVADAPWMMGSTLNRHRIAREDGSVVARLRAAGAVVAGLGTMAEMAMWPETVNRIHGRALHPLDPRRTPGGSSGGDAALVASGAVTCAIGADGGGSVRIPAAYCGLYAHKPSSGMVPLAGHVPMDRGPDSPAAPLAQFFTPGPMCRDANDLWPLLCVMAGADGIQTELVTSVPTTLPLPSPALLAGKTIYVLPAPRIRGAQKPDAAQISAVEVAAQALEAHGARLKSVRADLLAEAFWIWVGTLRCTANFDMELLMGNGRRLRLFNEIIRQSVGRGHHTAAGLILALSARLDPTGPRFWRRWQRLGQELGAELSVLLGPDALLLCPAVPGAAPHHNHAFRHLFNIAACAVFNVLGNPASVAPIHNGPEGLPRAVQIIARHGADHLTISAALALSQAHLSPSQWNQL
jgi:fatty acid amide hydrolase 2